MTVTRERERPVSYPMWRARLPECIIVYETRPGNLGLWDREGAMIWNWRNRGSKRLTERVNRRTTNKSRRGAIDSTDVENGDGCISRFRLDNDDNEESTKHPSIPPRLRDLSLTSLLFTSPLPKTREHEQQLRNSTHDHHTAAHNIARTVSCHPPTADNLAPTCALSGAAHHFLPPRTPHLDTCGLAPLGRRRRREQVLATC